MFLYSDHSEVFLLFLVVSAQFHRIWWTFNNYSWSGRNYYELLIHCPTIVSGNINLLAGSTKRNWALPSTHMIADYTYVCMYDRSQWLELSTLFDFANETISFIIYYFAGAAMLCCSFCIIYLRPKQIAIAKINKSTATQLRFTSETLRRFLFSFSPIFILIMLTWCVSTECTDTEYRISFITHNIPIYLHYTFENLLPFALILARGRCTSYDFFFVSFCLLVMHVYFTFWDASLLLDIQTSFCSPYCSWFFSLTGFKLFTCYRSVIRSRVMAVRQFSAH